MFSIKRHLPTSISKIIKIPEQISEKIILLFLGSASFLTRFFYFSYPNSTVFDEVHFGKFISGYFTGEYFFDIHPPLAKLLISLMGWLGGFVPGFSFAEIGQQFADSTYLWLRFLPSLAGFLLPFVIYFLAKKINLSRMTAFLIAALVIFDGGVLVQSRFILLDSFLLLFGFSALLAYAVYREKNRLTYLIIASALAGLAVSVKWTGFSFIGIIGLLELIHIIQKRSLGYFLKVSMIFLIAPILYASFFVIHLKLLPKSGPGNAFMTPEFQKNLIGSPYYENTNTKSKNLAGQIIELNKEMYRANRDLTAPHPYASKWYTWPFIGRPIYYWHADAGTTPEGLKLDARIYFLGNPITWWLGTIAILYILLDLIPRANDLRKIRLYIIEKKYEALIALGFIVNILPFVGIARAMFLYHYMPALIFSMFALGWLTEQIGNKKIAAGVLIIGIASFIFFAPLYYGTPLTESEYHLRVWFGQWQ